MARLVWSETDLAGCEWRGDVKEVEFQMSQLRSESYDDSKSASACLPEPCHPVVCRVTYVCVLRVSWGGGNQVTAGHHSAGDSWVTLAGFTCDRCSPTGTTVAEERFSRLVNATPKDLGNIPGRLFVGSCSDAVQWAGYHHELSMDSQWWAVGCHCSAESSVQ